MQIPTPLSVHSSSHPPLSEIREAAENDNDDYSTPYCDHGAQEEALILRDIALLASARKLHPSSTIFEANRSSCRLELTERIKQIFEEEKNILCSIDTKKLNDHQAPSRMQMAAYRGFVQVMEKITRDELYSLRESYKHLALFWITVARFEACHGHLKDAIKLLNDGVLVLQEDTNHQDVKEINELIETSHQIQSRYGVKDDNAESHSNEDRDEEPLLVTPRKHVRMNHARKQAESPTVNIPRRSPRFVKSPK